MNKITINFGNIQLEAEIFNTRIAREFMNLLPIEITDISQWGNEVYGSITKDLGIENPVPEIPEGGIAYTNQGNYLCVFYGQQPAWPVEYIGKITGDWQKLKNHNAKQMIVSRI